MKQRSLRDLTVSEIGLGCMPMSWAYAVADVDPEEVAATLRRAVELGVTLLDTADVYGPFTNEMLIREYVVDAGLRDQVTIATKGGLVPIDATNYGRNGRPDDIRAACDASLERLGVDMIDLYQLHRVDPDVPVEETWGAMADLVETGKVRYLGLSEASVEEILVADSIHPVTSVQSELSLWTDENVVNGVLSLCEERGIGFLAYCPLGRGYLTGTVTADVIGEGDFRSANPRFTAEALTANESIVAGILPPWGDRGAGGPRLGPGAGGSRRTHPGHEASPLARGQRGCSRHRAHDGGSCRPRRATALRCSALLSVGIGRSLGGSDRGSDRDP